MKLYRIIFFIGIAFFVFSCGKKGEKKETTKQIKTTTLPKEKKDVVEIDSAKAVKQSILRTKTYKKKEGKVTNNLVVANNKPVTDVAKVSTKAVVKNNLDNNTFIYLKKILKECKVGQTLTQKELSTNLNIPKEAIKLVKSIEKVSESKIDIKWKSTWLVEKVSDAKLKDGILKMNFKNDKMYTSGSAIGIKYDNQMYYDLVITGRNARIPKVKGYYWQIGKD